ncbi:hypothetical protein OC846_002601 [Tilletia horrida]|uniref:Uncharacterized protein n=1 Tax=Tilletia horrida TaxID=155126 RepID=A0AAN6JUR7_9BASI|nr:hypothetical protein OC845_002872 [Tilletia horrida]KAK0553229.1 hypothetical protein OC846_002601 [Tilletia horrida]KAK0565287.1 hypothetical protein OC861_003834 [Tilletia horrida]
MSAPIAPASGILARAINPVAAAAASSMTASATSAAGAEIIASGIATSSSTVSMAAGRSSAAILRSTHVGVTASIGGSPAGSATRTFTTTATTLVKEAPQSSSPAAAAIREAAHSPEANSRIRVTDGPPDLSYVPEGTPITSEDPKKMPAASPSSIPASQSQHASTKSGARHPGVAEMAKGATLPGAGEDAVTPEERSTKVWSTNQRPPDYNPEEGRRNPILHGGSNEGGFDSDGKSKT